MVTDKVLDTANQLNQYTAASGVTPVYDTDGKFLEFLSSWGQARMART